MSGAPDLTAPVAGFRAWRVANGRLVSPYVPCRWEGRVMRAECYDANRGLLRGVGWLDRPHESPHPDCRCGIYAYHTPGKRTYFGESWWCAGLVSVWGHLEVHADGLRAQFARVEALSAPKAACRPPSLTLPRGSASRSPTRTTCRASPRSWAARSPSPSGPGSNRPQ